MARNSNGSSTNALLLTKMLPIIMERISNNSSTRSAGAGNYGSSSDLLDYLLGLAQGSTKRQRNRGERFSQNQVNEMYLNWLNTQEQRSWQEDMYNRYESPAALMRQYEEAGLNGALAMTGGAQLPDMNPNSAAAQATPSANSEMQTMDVVSQIMAIFSGMGNIASNFASTFSNMNRNKYQNELNAAQSRTEQARQLNINADTEGKIIDNDLKKIDLAYRDIEKQMALSESQQRINESVSRCREIASTISVNNTRIQLMDSQIDLNVKGLDKMDTEMVLNQSKTFLNNMNAEKIQALLPFQQALMESQTRYNAALTDQSRAAATREYSVAALNYVETLMKQDLIEKGYAESLIEQMKASANQANTQAKLNKTLRWTTAVNCIIGNTCKISSTIVDNCCKITGTGMSVLSGGMLNLGGSASPFTSTVTPF